MPVQVCHITRGKEGQQKLLVSAAEPDVLPVGNEDDEVRLSHWQSPGAERVGERLAVTKSQ
jgi:hypothetical protein